MGRVPDSAAQICSPVSGDVLYVLAAGVVGLDNGNIDFVETCPVQFSPVHIYIMKHIRYVGIRPI